MSKNEITSEQTEKNQSGDTKEETPKEAPQEETISETLKVDTPKEEKQTVGLDKYLDLKKKHKQAKEDLESALEKGKDTKEISGDIETLAKEHNVDPEFLEKLASEIQQKAELRIDEKLKPLTERDAVEKREKKFQERLKTTLEDMPEYKDVINVDIVKQLAFNKANADKTFKQLLEEVYGQVSGERKQMETAVSQTNTAPTKLDYDKAVKDTKYFAEVMADPELKKEYNEKMLANPRF